MLNPSSIDLQGMTPAHGEYRTGINLIRMSARGARAGY